MTKVSVSLSCTYFFVDLPPTPFSSVPQPAARSFAPRVYLCREMGAAILTGTQNLAEAFLSPFPFIPSSRFPLVVDRLLK